MRQIPRNKLLREPPGARRVNLALRNSGLRQGDVADGCNCDSTTVNRVVNGFNRTALNQRIRREIANRTGFDEDWLFAHAEPPLQSEALQ